MRTVPKAFAYITRRQQLLAFDHVELAAAGTQVPAGTIQPGEAPEAAVLREAIEETGWTRFAAPVLLGRQLFDFSPFGRAELHDRWFFHLPIKGEPPVAWRHFERDGGARPDPIEFRFFWLSFDQAEGLIADHGHFVPALRKLVAQPHGSGDS